MQTTPRECTNILPTRPANSGPFCFLASNRPQTDLKPTSNRSQTDPRPTPDRPQTDPRPIPNRSQTDPKPTPDRPQTDPRPTKIMKKPIPESVPKRRAAKFHAEPRYSCAEISFLDPFGEGFLKCVFGGSLSPSHGLNN